MKRTLMTVGLMFVLAAGVFAQAGKTNYYKYVETVNPNTGVRSNENLGGIYITFTNNSCYESDEKGIQIKKFDGSPGDVHTYLGEQDNLYVYEYRLKQDPFMEMYFTGPIFSKFVFSKDYKRINFSSSRFNGVRIYELDKPPSRAPSTFY
jgi:hypothetical protein